VKSRIRTTRPFGITLVMSFYVAKIILYIETTLVRLDYRFYRSIVDSKGIRDLCIALLSVFIVIGLTGMRKWGRMLAIVVSGLLAVVSGGVYLLTLGMGFWTLLPTGFWSNAEVVASLLFEVYAVWYLLRVETREIFRVAESTSVPRDGQF
jgi:hypothetical protein